MPFTLQKFAEKIKTLRVALDSNWDQVSTSTGIDANRLADLESASSAPTGDEILILANHFRCDFAWLIEDEAQNPDENMRAMLRFEGDKLSARDRRAINDFLYLCKCDALLEELLGFQPEKAKFSFPQQSGVYTSQGARCAEAVRAYYDLPSNAIIPDIFSWLRSRGYRVFRRLLPDSRVSGLFIDHPIAGRCILINASEDLYRQRFSAAHELGHSLLDLDRHFSVSTDEDSRSNDFREMRANTFASHFLMPTPFLKRRWTDQEWRKPENIIQTADQLWVSIPALLAALKREKIIDAQTREEIRAQRLRLPNKREPELYGDLSERQAARMTELLNLGLNQQYVGKCFEAHRRGMISWGKLAEVLTVAPSEIAEIGALFRMGGTIG